MPAWPSPHGKGLLPFASPHGCFYSGGLRCLRLPSRLPVLRASPSGLGLAGVVQGVEVEHRRGLGSQLLRRLLHRARFQRFLQQQGKEKRRMGKGSSTPSKTHPAQSPEHPHVPEQPVSPGRGHSPRRTWGCRSLCHSLARGRPCPLLGPKGGGGAGDTAWGQTWCHPQHPGPAAPSLHTPSRNTANTRGRWELRAKGLGYG